MSAVFQKILQEVEQNNITAARNMIKAYLKENPRQEQGWVVAFNIFHKKENKVYCLEQILAINPANVKAKSLLHKIQNPGTYSTSIQTQPKPVLRKSATPIFSNTESIESQTSITQTKNNGVVTENLATAKQAIFFDKPQINSKTKELLVETPKPITPTPKKELPANNFKSTPAPKQEVKDSTPTKKELPTNNSKPTPAPKKEVKVIRRIVTRPAKIENANISIENEATISPKPKLAEEAITEAQRSQEDLCIVLNRAIERKDFALIQLLFEDEAEKVEMQLEEVLMRELIFKSPPMPLLKAKQRDTFNRIKALADTNDLADIKKAISILQNIWAANIENVGLRSWMAYLQIKLGNLSEGVQLLRSILRLKEPKFNAFALWNLAVIAAKAKEDKLALQLLVLLLDKNGRPDFLKVAIALAVKVPDAPIFFSLLPKLWHLNYHPLAIYLATNYPNEPYLNKFSEVFIQQTAWNPPSPSYRFEQNKEYKKVISQAIVSRNVPRLIAWLKARIAISKVYVPDYLALSDVLEKDVGDMDAAFEVLLKRLEIKKLSQAQKETAARDLIEFCIRSNRNDLKRAAFKAIQYSYGNQEMIFTIEDWETLSEVPKPATNQQVVALSSFVDKDILNKQLAQLAQKVSTISAPVIAEKKLPKQENKETIVPPIIKKEFSKQKTQTVNNKDAYALFIDHENIIKSLEQIRQAYGRAQPENPQKQFAQDLEKLLETITQRINAPLTHKVAVAFWNRFPDKDFQPIYINKGFITPQPRSVKKANAVDFHLVEQIHQFWRMAINEQQTIRQIVVLTGDGDFSAIALAAKKEGIGMQVWGGRKSFGDRFRQLLGKDAFVLLEDVLK